jgi:hypothetical protein
MDKGEEHPSRIVRVLALVGIIVVNTLIWGALIAVLMAILTHG